MLRVRMSSHRYCLIVDGELGRRYAAAFEGMAISAHDGLTEIEGPVIDSSQLLGLLERIAGLGLTLRSLTRLEAESGDSTGASIARRAAGSP
jgi:hypothetical protein